MDTLNPCPFCGHEAVMKKENHGFGNPFVYRVGCETIDCCGRRQTQTGQHAEQEAIKLWNKRPSEWVSVEDRLPVKLDWYRGYIQSETEAYQEDVIWHPTRGWCYQYGGQIFEPRKVTHWMPLAAPPKGDE